MSGRAGDRPSQQSAQTIYLNDAAADPVCLIFQPSERVPARDTAVILCPPFGWDEACSYRSRREWAQTLAGAGYPSVRLSFPSTGDSGGGPRDPGRLDAWTAAVASTARWVRAATTVRQVVAIGIGLGGLVVYRAVVSGAPIDDLVLWATPTRGRSLVRQLRAFSKLEAARFFEGNEPPPPLPAGELEAGGFLLSAETVEELEGLELTALALPPASSRRVLLLGQDGIGPESHLRDQLESRGVAVTVDAGRGYAMMTSPPQQARAPRELIERVQEWLDETSAFTSVTKPDVATTDRRHSTLMNIGNDEQARETALTIEQPFGSMVGILTEPLRSREIPLCAVLLNAGAVRRIGPNRMWVEAARRWAARGVPTLRLDIEGIGDADGDAGPYVEDAGLYVPALVPQVLAALDDLQARGLGERFVLGGLCSGAYWSLHAALADSRVSAALMLNPRALVWDPRLAPAHDFRRLRTAPMSWSTIRRKASLERTLALATWMLSSRQRKTAVDDVLDRLRTSGKRALLLFADQEPLQQDLVLSGRIVMLEQWPNVTLEYVGVRDHTLRPLWSQRKVHEALDRALDRELAIEAVLAAVSA